MAGSDQTRTTTGWRTASKFYRRPPGLGWLLALLLVPLLLGAIGYATLEKSKKETNPPSVNASPTLNVPSVTAPNATVPGVSFAPLSITRNGNDITLSGDLPDGAAKASLLDGVKGALGPGVNVVDNLNIKPGVNTPDFSGLGSVLKAAAPIPDFNFKLNGDTITLTGTAVSDDERAAVEAAARAAWPNMTISNQIQVKPAPAPVAGAGCANLQADVTGLLTRPINYDTNVFTLAAPEQQMLSRVADRLKSCPTSNVTVTGYTDNVGNDAINIPLSTNRAKTVADYLVSQGVASDHITSKGLASADPIASNDTPDGRAANRRVVITVS